ncbi:MAG: NAD-dependent DNA ligase LigA, partial [Bacteroidia bacterium]|nr:NAD-dependent DNA ligase LigA [Bacteroidia bacterium]
MNLPEDKNAYNALVNELKAHNYAYYVLSQPSISDYDFDQLLKKCEAIEKLHPEWVQPDSPTQVVGGEVTKNFEQVKHTYPMMSLGNTYSADELREFDQRVRKAIGDDFTYVCELKFDGLAISISYENGKMIRAVTRGDGVQGDDVTANVKTIRSIPQQLHGNYPASFDIRGEIFMHKKTFERLNNTLKKELLEQGVDEDKIAERLYKNPRNFASGSLKMQDSKEVAKRSLDAFLYFVYTKENICETHAESLKLAESWGFKVSDHYQECASLEDVLAFIQKYDTERHHLSYEIDGVVIKVNQYKHQEDLGFTAKIPKWAISYKYKAESALTQLLSVSYQVGRTGAITPVANLKPVQLAGTTVKRASLYNADELARLDLHDMDWVYVEKGGEIIPKITSINTEKRDLFAKKIQYIQACPECGTELLRKEGEAIHYCPNDSHCKPQLIGRLEHFVSRKAMNIDGLGVGIIELLFERKFVRYFSDFYKLHLVREKLIGLTKLFEVENEYEYKYENEIYIHYQRVLYLFKIAKKVDEIKHLKSESELNDYISKFEEPKKQREFNFIKEKIDGTFFKISDILSFMLKKFGYPLEINFNHLIKNILCVNDLIEKVNVLIDEEKSYSENEKILLKNFFDKHNTDILKLTNLKKIVLQEKAVNNIIEGINNSKNCNLGQFIYALGIKNLGLVGANLI